ncbi:DUF58 domain-containing protein [Fervidobacterium sp. 2310opik-2]|uniref:DUF58 domain-containing protein n=1 Tax=Fervidobacterium sp. 2310opik-2 TaxID=1755815 RepID=UPI0013DF3BC7|nr:DUF58 domain-containing protein [Fervidobacterium sp. 2310opik-2]KAF2961596.1 hypothetical protein AS161_08595 [Fervidobacterium sp. 2310opik-2]
MNANSAAKQVEVNKKIWAKYSPFLYFLLFALFVVNIFWLNKYIILADALVIYVFYDYFRKKRVVEEIEISVDARGRVFANEEFYIKFKIKSPYYVKLTLTPPLIINKEPKFIELFPNKEEEVIYSSKLGTRGTKKLGAYSIKISGFGNLFALIRNEFIDSDIKVLPDMEEVSVFLERILEAIPVIKSNYKLSEDVSYIKDLRDYNNEPLNRIHWKNSAKYDKLIVKDYEYAGTANLYILLDLNLPGAIYSKNAWLYIRKKYEEDAIKATTGLIHYFSTKHEKINLLLSDKKGFRKIIEKDYVIYFDYLSDAEGTIENEKDTTDFVAELLTTVQPVDTVIIISMFLTKEEVKKIIELRGRCGRVIVLVMPYGYRDEKTKKFKSYYDVPIEIRELYKYAKVLRDENVIVEIWHENVSLNEGLINIQEEW